MIGGTPVERKAWRALAVFQEVEFDGSNPGCFRLSLEQQNDLMRSMGDIAFALLGLQNPGGLFDDPLQDATHHLKVTVEEIYAAHQHQPHWLLQRGYDLLPTKEDFEGQ
jgi:hypothetical protein